MTMDKLLSRRRIWQKKPVLRQVYNQGIFERIMSNIAGGDLSLEVGGGGGEFKSHSPDLISSDLIPCPWHDLALNAENLPFKDGALDNVVGVDCLHHVSDPLRFLNEGARVLRRGGRMVLVEPWISPLGHVVNRFFMPEDLDLSWEPGQPINGNKCEKNPFDANPAVPFVLFEQRRPDLSKYVPLFQLVKLERFGFLAYILSLGFRSGSLLPTWAYKSVDMIETSTIRYWRDLCALKALVVLEKQ